jgi:hypothetical protein
MHQMNLALPIGVQWPLQVEPPSRETVRQMRSSVPCPNTWIRRPSHEVVTAGPEMNVPFPMGDDQRSSHVAPASRDRAQ